MKLLRILYLLVLGIDSYLGSENSNIYSKKAYPWDNAAAEAFFKYMKKEELDRRTFSSIQEVQLACFEYIESFYNRHRPHSTIRMLTPEEKESFYYNNC